MNNKAKTKASAPAALPVPDPSSYSQEYLDILIAENKTWREKIKHATDLQVIEDIVRRICGDAKYVRDGMIFPCGVKKGLTRYCVPPKDGRMHSPLKTPQKTIDAVNEKAGTNIDWSAIEAEEGGKHLQAYVPWAVVFIPSKVGGGNGDLGHIYKPKITLDKHGRLNGESRSGVTVGSGVDLGATNADELKKGDVPQALIEKLKPYLGLKKGDACKALKDNPLVLTEEEADAMNEFGFKKHSDGTVKNYELTKEFYSKKENSNKNLKEWKYLTKGEQTALASRKYHNGNILERGVNGSLVDAIGGNGGEEAIRDAYKNRNDYEKYKRRYQKELGWMGIDLNSPEK